MVDLLACKGLPVFLGFFLLQKNPTKTQTKLREKQTPNIKKILHGKSHFCVQYRFELQKVSLLQKSVMAYRLLPANSVKIQEFGFLF